MELIQNFLKMDSPSFYNMFAAFCMFAVFVCGLLLFKVLRSYYIVSVNCWFCNSNTKVSFSKRNQFICPSCSQYNGFKDDGSYNCTIDAQFDIHKNANIYQDIKNKPNEPYNFGNNLCEVCNIQQSLKVRALAEFSSMSDDSTEIEEFKKKLEEMYDLCQQCEATVHQTLGIQNSLLKPKLIAWRILKSKITNNFMIPKETVYFVSRRYKMILSIAALYLVVSKLGACFLNSPLNCFHHYNNLVDRWILQIEKVDILLTVFGLCFVCQFCLHNMKSMKMEVLGWLVMVLLHNDKNTGYFSNEVSCYVQLFVALLIFLHATHSTALTAKRSVTKSLVFTPKIQLSTPKVQSTSPVNRSHFSSSAPSSPEDEIGIPLNDLKIGNPQKNFETNSIKDGVYYANFGSNRNCFSDTSSQRNRNILRQSKLGCKITQSSWVAGGYWGESPKRRQPNRQSINDLNKRNDEFDHFSRTSSKSSGFVSQASEPNSFYYAQHIDPANMARRNLSARFGNYDERKSVDSADACSVSSCYSAHPAERHLHNNWRSSQCSLYSAYNDTHAMDNISSKLPPETNIRFSWCNAWLAFALGFSISANVFLFIAFYKYDFFVK